MFFAAEVLESDMSPATQALEEERAELQRLREEAPRDGDPKRTDKSWNHDESEVKTTDINRW